MARTLWLYNLYRALCTAHLHKFFYVFAFLDRGLSMTQIVLLHTIFGGAVILLEVPTGAWADRLGRRPSMGLGALLMALASLGYYLAPGFAAIALCEFVFAAGLTLTSGADSAYLYDQLHAAGRAREYLRREANASASKYIGLGVAAAAGGVLAHLQGISATFLVTAVVSLAAFVVTWFFPGTHGEPLAPLARLRARLSGAVAWRRSTRPVASASSAAGPHPSQVSAPSHPRRGPASGGTGEAQPPGLAPATRVAEAIRAIRQSPAILWAILYSSLIFVLIRVSDTLFQPVLRNQGFDMLGLGLAFAGLSFAAAAAAMRVGRIRWDRWEDAILWAMPIALAACFFFVSLLGPFVAIGLMVAHFAVTGVYSPVVKTLINAQLTDSHVRATVLSAESAAKRLVVVLVTPVIGLMFRFNGDRGSAGPSTADLRPALVLCGAIALLALGARYLYLRRRRAADNLAGAPHASPTPGVAPVAFGPHAEGAGAPVRYP